MLSEEMYTRKGNVKLLMENFLEEHCRWLEDEGESNPSSSSFLGGMDLEDFTRKFLKAEKEDKKEKEVRCVTLLFKDNEDEKYNSKIKVTVQEIKSNGYDCYDLTFENTGSMKNNPLSIFDEDERDGVILAKNGMTKSMVEYLLKSDKELSKETGLATLEGYRGEIIQALKRLWD